MAASGIRSSLHVQKFDLKPQAEQFLRSVRTPRYVFLGMGLLVVALGLWLLLAEVPKLSLGLMGVAESGAILVLGFAEILGAVLIRPPKPCLGLEVGESQLLFLREGGEVVLTWNDPALRIVFWDASSDPRSSSTAKDAIRFSMRATARVVGAVPRECFVAIVAQARSLGLSVRNEPRRVGVLGSRHSFEVTSIGPSSSSAIAVRSVR